MKKMIPLVLGSLLLLGTMACSEESNSAATDGGVGTDQMAANDEQQTDATDDGIREEQRESDARAREQRDGTDAVGEGEQQTSEDLAVDVRNSLESNLPGSRLAVDVDNTNGMATIEGTVTTQEQFDEIEPLVMAFEGIQSVDVQATVDPN